MNIDNLEADLKLLKDKAPELYSDIFEMSVPFYQFYRKIFGGGSKIIDEKYKLSHNDMDILESLFYSGEDNYTLRPTEIYDKLLFTTGGVTKIVTRLEKRGFVKRVENPNDKRSKFIQLTKEGEAIMRLASKDIMDYEESCYINLDENDRKELKRILVKAIMD